MFPFRSDNINTFFISIQQLLMKKDNEYGGLQYLVSKATVQSANNINEIVNCVNEIYKVHIVLPENEDKVDLHSRIDCYKYLLLNTNFTVQQLLAEDSANGHITDIFPPLSPYLFIQILWNLKFEDILIESIHHMPLDLCVEILEIVNRCIEELEFERKIHVIFELIIHIYIHCLLLRNTYHQTENFDEVTKNLIANFQMLLDRLSSDKLISGLPDLEEAELFGNIFKRVICVTKECMKYKTAEISLGNEQSYKVTFGRKPYNKLETELLNSTISTLDDGLVALLLDYIKKIDCDIYLDWAELDDNHDTTISLQRAIAIECHYFLEFMKTDLELSQNDHLKECLQQLFDPEETNLSVQEICHGISYEKTEDIEQLMDRYKEWDQSTLTFILKRSELIKEHHFEIIFKYLNFIFSEDSCNNDVKNKACSTFMMLLLQRNTSEIYSIMLTYVITHLNDDNNNYLKILWDQTRFMIFLEHCATYTSIEIQDYTLLIFVGLNSRATLTILCKILIGHPDYNNFVFPLKDLLFLRPFLCIRDTNNCTFLISILREICMENKQWNMKKFTDLVQAMIKENITSADDILNEVYIPYLMESSLHYSNMNSIIINIRKTLSFYENANLVLLFVSIAKRISKLRNCVSIPKYLSEELFANMMRIIGHFLAIPTTELRSNDRIQIIDSITNFIEPLDKACFAPLWHHVSDNIMNIIEGYERRCYPILEKIKIAQVPERFRIYMSDVDLDREAFLRHIFLTSIGFEYTKHSYEIVVMSFFFFGWKNKQKAIDNVVRIMVDTIQLCVEYPNVAPPDTSIVLIKHMASLCKNTIIHSENRKSDCSEYIYKLLLSNINSLKETINRTPYSSKFELLITSINAIPKGDIRINIENIAIKINIFSMECIQLTKEVENKNDVVNSATTKSLRCTTMYKAHTFICACFRISTKTYHCINQMDRLFSSNGNQLSPDTTQ